MDMATIPRRTRRRRSNGDTGDKSMTITLQSGGTLTVSTTADLFAASDTDRDLVFGIVDKLRDYRAAQE